MLRGRPTPAPRPGLCLPSAGPAGLGGAGRVPAGIAVLCPTGLPTAVAAATLLRQRAWEGGRQAGQHRSDRLGLLLRKEAASLTAQQLHLVGEPWRPRSWPSTTAAALAGGGSSGLACGWLGTRIGVGHVRLLARPSTAVGTAGRVPWPSSTAGSVAPDPDRVSITPIRASARSPAPTPTSVPSRRRSSAKAARRGGVERAAPRRPPRTPGRTAAGRHGWLGSPSATGQRMLAATARLPPGGGASVRSPADHRPFTRSAARSSVDHPPLGGAAGAEPRDTQEAKRRPRRAAAPIPDARKGAVCATRNSHPVRQPQEP
jgi:hypothetical protein